MGAGIAHAFLVAGATVTIVETGAEAASAADARVQRSVAKAAERGLLREPAAAVLSRVSVTSNPTDLGGAGLVVEAVPEDVALKVEVLATIAQAVPEAVFASNTSSLSVAELALSLPAPERFLGLHFFNPVPASDEGVASATDIDTAMTLGYRHPVGPLRTTDIVGLDVRLAIAEHLARELGPRFEPPQVLRDHVAAGRVGRKSGEGFYQW